MKIANAEMTQSDKLWLLFFVIILINPSQDST
jgi:hypothetical protein